MCVFHVQFRIQDILLIVFFSSGLTAVVSVITEYIPKSSCGSISLYLVTALNHVCETTEIFLENDFTLIGK